MLQIRNIISKIRTRKIRLPIKMVLLLSGLCVLFILKVAVVDWKEEDKKTTNEFEVRKPLMGSTVWNASEYIIYDSSDEDSEEYYDDGVMEISDEHDLPMKEKTDSKLSTEEQDVATLINALDITEIESRFRQRQDYVTSSCQNLDLSTPKVCQMQQAKYQLKTVQKHKLVYCAVEKAGSTFWLRILKVLSADGNATNPLTFQTGQAYDGGYGNLMLTSWDSVVRLLTMTNNVMFVRNPFGRLFSAWLDKLYSTNPYYWSVLGRTIITHERPDASIHSMNCGHDVTFLEFVRYILKLITEKDCIDPHFASNYHHCLPCNVTYDYIGSYENLMEDTLYVLHALNLSKLITFSNVEEAAEVDAIFDASSWVFANRLAIEKCMPFRDGLFRVWRRLQARGVLSKFSKFNETLPFSDPFNKLMELTEEQFRNILLTARSAYDYNERVTNREEALAEAFRSIPPVVINEFVRVFMIDFQVFGYDLYPDFLKTSGEGGTSFRYFG